MKEAQENCHHGNTGHQFYCLHLPGAVCRFSSSAYSALVREEVAQSSVLMSEIVTVGYFNIYQLLLDLLKVVFEDA